MYEIFVITSAVACAMTAFALFLRIRAVFLDRSNLKKNFWHICVKVGFLGTTGLILYVLLDAGKLTEVNWRTYAYIISFSIAAIGYMGISLQAARDIAESETERERVDNHGN